MQTALANTINKENIRQLVRTFYPTIIEDPLVGPFFVKKLGDDISSDMWQEHLELLTNFWAFVALGDLEYKGHPMAPHFGLKGISKTAFKQWLQLFSEAVDKVYTKEAGEFFKLKSVNIAENFMRNLGI